MRIFVILFSILFLLGCAESKSSCDLEARRLYPGSNIEIIEADYTSVYLIDQDFYVFCNRWERTRIDRAYSGSWKDTYCARLDSNNRWDAEDFKKYKCGPEKSR